MGMIFNVNSFNKEQDNRFGTVGYGSADTGGRSVSSAMAAMERMKMRFDKMQQEKAERQKYTAGIAGTAWGAYKKGQTKSRETLLGQQFTVDDVKYDTFVKSGYADKKGFLGKQLTPLGKELSINPELTSKVQDFENPAYDPKANIEQRQYGSQTYGVDKPKFIPDTTDPTKSIANPDYDITKQQFITERDITDWKDAGGTFDRAAYGGSIVQGADEKNIAVFREASSKLKGLPQTTGDAVIGGKDEFVRKLAEGGNLTKLAKGGAYIGGAYDIGSAVFAEDIRADKRVAKAARGAGTIAATAGWINPALGAGIAAGTSLWEMLT